MRLVVPREVPFSTCEHYPCDLVAFDAILRYYGYLTEMVIHNQWTFIYSRADCGRISIGARSTDYFQDMRDWGIDAEYRRERNSASAWSAALASLESGCPIPILTDTYYLEQYYYPGTGHHSGHFVILAGYDYDADLAAIVDPSWLVRFRGDLPAKGIQNAWGSEYSSPHTWIEFMTSEISLSSTSILRKISDSVRLALEEDTSVDGSYRGTAGIEELAEDLYRTKDCGADETELYLKAAFGDLRGLCIERDGLRRCLNGLGDRIDIPYMVSINEKLATLTHKWLQVRNLCFRGYRIPALETFTKIRDRLLALRDMETLILNDMSRNLV